ncbi:MAG: endonuclease/exonuclease/phosphatase family protein [Planctomycetota bacterium]|jgi:endonuclease/exonuclease/phosphatase family metal-dependent hydrolase
MRIRVLTWNIHKAIGGVDRRYRPERVIEVIRHYDPDIALLQEVDEGVRRSSFDRQVDLIGDALNMRNRAFGPNVKLRKGRYGNATLARWPLADVRNIDLTIAPKKARGALYARCRVRQEGHTRTLVLFNFHLGLAGFERAIQMRRFFRSHPFAHFHARTPILIGGDFNDLWGTLGRRFLRPADFVRAGEVVHTYPAMLPARPLDGIFIRGDLISRRCFRSRMDLAREASDHLPLIADLNLTMVPAARIIELSGRKRGRRAAGSGTARFRR